MNVTNGTISKLKDHLISCVVFFLCWSSLSQNQFCPIQKQAASLLRGSPSQADIDFSEDSGHSFSYILAFSAVFKKIAKK